MVYRKYNSIDYDDFKVDLGEAMRDVLKCPDLDSTVKNYNHVLRELLNMPALEHRRAITLRHRPCGFSNGGSQNHQIIVSSFVNRKLELRNCH